MQKFKKQSWLLVFSTPFLALGLGWAQWDWGKPVYSDASWIKLLALFLVFWAFVHFVLVLPMIHGVWRNLEGHFGPFKRIALSSTLISLPLISFSYWWGEVRTILQAQEVTISIIPSVLLSVLIYDRRQNSRTWSLSLTAMIFFNLVLVNEILGPFQTYFYLMSHDNRFEYLRALVPAFTIALYYRLEFEPKGSSWSGIYSIYHTWKSRRFSQMLKPTDPGDGSLQPESKP